MGWKFDFSVVAMGDRDPGPDQVPHKSLETTNHSIKKKKKSKKSPLFPWFFTLPGIAFTTPVLQNITSSILISKIHAKNP